MTSRTIVHGELSFAGMGAALEVRNILGNGFPEAVNEGALAIELALHGIPFEGRKAVDLSYKGNLAGTHRVDFAADGDPIVGQVRKQQVVSYLRATDLQQGILVTFGCTSVVYGRTLSGGWRHSSHPQDS